jgi:hypothetical protein
LVPRKQILIEPVFAQWIQASQGKTAYGFDLLHNQVVPHIQLVKAYGYLVG